MTTSDDQVMGRLYVDFPDKGPLSAQDKLIIRAVIISHHETAVSLLLVSRKVDMVAQGKSGVPLAFEDVKRQADMTQQWIDRAFLPEFGIKIRFERV